MQFSQVKADLVDLVWSQVLPIVKKGMKHGAGDSTDPDFMLREIRHGQMLLWAIHENGELLGVVVVSEHRYPMKRAVVVELVAGKFGERADEALSMGEQLLRDYRDLVGADTIEATCREGLSRRLKNWRRKAILMELS